ncbi:MAG TPA: HAD-IIB family hydrolase [Deltaproteobacteria bacterium]|nr:HAD-IIB family hydrolase [Deltaproteobacteria bacterium]
MRNDAQKKGPRRLLVFTDLDGSLLNHGDYSWEAARPALGRIRDLGIPLVICTSKTRPEVELIRKDIGLTGPFIVENGGGIFFPREYEEFSIGGSVVMDAYRCIPLGIPYARIRSFVEEAAKEFPIRGFGDMSVEEVSRRTGLTPDQAALAKAREFTEPFVMEHAEDLPALERTAHLKGLIITRGGRFFHCMGFGNDKGGAVARVTEIFSRHWQEGVLSMGFGDSPNDFPLLKAVDMPVLIPHDDGGYEDLDLPGLTRAPHPGSRGWNEAAEAIIKDMHAGKRRKKTT